jgi:hypothetical protein
MIIIGAGVIGVELGSVWSRLGAQVSSLLVRVVGTSSGPSQKRKGFGGQLPYVQDRI